MALVSKLFTQYLCVIYILGPDYEIKIEFLNLLLKGVFEAIAHDIISWLLSHSGAEIFNSRLSSQMWSKIENDLEMRTQHKQKK